MHSSRMHTARLLTVSQLALLGGVPARRCTCLGGVPTRGVYLLGGTCLGGVPAWRVYLPGGCTCPGGGVVPAWGVVPARGGTCPGGTCPGTPPVDRMTDRCKNITLPQISFAGGNNAKIVQNWCRER